MTEQEILDAVTVCRVCGGTGIRKMSDWDRYLPCENCDERGLVIRPNPSDDVATLVIQDMRDRREWAIKKYGKPLVPSSANRTLQDLYEELMDACVYIRNEIEKGKQA